MASLASLPQELVDMILSDLGPAHLGKVRLLSRFYNARFKNLFWYLVFQTLQIDLRPSCIERLILLGKGPEVASVIQNIIVRPQKGQDLKVSQITPLLTKAFAGLPDIKSINIQVPHGTGGFDYWNRLWMLLLRSFGLPKLKALKLVDAAVTPNDFKKLFGSVDLDVVDISQCRMKNLKVDWFEILKHLRNGNINKIKELRFVISSYHGSELYDLPNLRIDVNSDWTSEGNSCKVTLHSGLSGFYNTQKNLWDELGTTDDQDEFWSSLTNSKWTLPRTTRWKRLQIATEEYRSTVSKLVSVLSSEHDPHEAFEVKQEYDTKVARLQEEEELDNGVEEE
ncbi:hypothetical protein TWF788_009413 [Orbilia oligospora]|uniref:F-box domain-containing protein n=1 Tax=Orbilia oligospora TaxID=2813651 RepID=A0A7C8PC37_ORBOL|nr:hypothetical protein TWF788_009413 [Orbilia oligospora]